MKFMQAYRSPFPSYEGSVIVEDNGTSQENISGCFEASQASDGRISIGCRFPGGKWMSAEEDIRKHKLRYYDYDNGWSLQTEGGIHLSERMHAMYDVVIKTTTLRARKLSCGETPTYNSFTFAIANLVLSQSETHIHQPVTFDFRNSSLIIKPVEDYLDRIKRLRAVGGVEHTVDIIVDAPNGDIESLDGAASLMTDLIPILRLWSGNKLNWLYGKGYDYGGRLSETLHQSPVIGGYSEVMFRYGWSTHLSGHPSVTPCELAASDFPRQVRVLCDQNIREHIDGFVDACRASQFRETQGIAAATLLDALAAQYAEARGKGTIMSRSAFKKHVQPALHKAIDDISVPSVSDHMKCQIKSFVLGGYRSNMRNRVDLLSDKLKLCMNDGLKSRVIKVRNDLVHKGGFPDNKRSETDRNLLLWMNFVVLCRLVGYQGQLPPPPIAE